MGGWLRHGIFAAVYTAIAISVALTLPLSVDGMDPHTGLLFGLVVFVFGGLLHEFWARQEERERLEHRLWRLKEGQADIRGLLLKLEQRLDGHPASLQELDRLLSDARLLESLAAPAPEPTAHAQPAMAEAQPQLPLDATFAPPRASGPAPLPPADAAILEEIREALRADRIDLFLQPVVSLPQRKHRYYEVFSRIRRADGAHLLPEQYLPVAQRAGLIAGIDNMLLFRCIQLLRETEKRHQAVGFFYNISAATLADRDFMEEFASYLGRHPNLAAKLVFELGQAELMPDGSFSTGFLDGLRRLGFRFSMDQVERLEVDWAEMARHEIRHVKLDAARLLDPAGPFADPQAARDLKGLLDRNAIDLIAEKVETDRQLLELLDLHIDFGQGYLFGEPKLARKAG